MGKTYQHRVDVLFTVSLFGVFAVCALMLVVTGAGIYQKNVESLTANFTVRTSLNYVAEKMRQNDSEDAVFITEQDGVQALVLEQPIGEETYQTWLYHSDGVLCELFAKKGEQLNLETGQEILKLHSFSMQEENGLFTFTASDEHGNKESIKLYPRCG